MQSQNTAFALALSVCSAFAQSTEAIRPTPQIGVEVIPNKSAVAPKLLANVKLVPAIQPPATDSPLRAREFLFTPQLIEVPLCDLFPQTFKLILTGPTTVIRVATPVFSQ
jgi:hypothetical protein